MRFSIAPVVVLALAAFTQAAPIMSRRDVDNSTNYVKARHYAREYDHESFNRRAQPLARAASTPQAVYKRVHARDFGRASRL
ncbi:hypothetical protein VKT23_008263 [Stygiomarasmius scandens]|uniref:Uncharacterized protein n=1 Tax=Marasmiellus scandens TaxID=2682957 RepID=A0ABR1JHQ8_9AGAR